MSVLGEFGHPYDNEYPGRKNISLVCIIYIEICGWHLFWWKDCCDRWITAQVGWLAHSQNLQSSITASLNNSNEATSKSYTCRRYLNCSCCRYLWHDAVPHSRRFCSTQLGIFSDVIGAFSRWYCWNQRYAEQLPNWLRIYKSACSSSIQWIKGTLDLAYSNRLKSLGAEWKQDIKRIIFISFRIFKVLQQGSSMLTAFYLCSETTKWKKGADVIL